MILKRKKPFQKQRVGVEGDVLMNRRYASDQFMLSGC